MSLETVLDRLHGVATGNRWLQLFTSITRILLAVGFIPPSIPKILHKPFTVLPDSNPVGHYFSALYQTGFYYEFIGWSQIIAAVLLLIPRTSHLGALMFFPIIFNIAVLTNSVGFAGTWLITLLMMLASMYLVAWEYPRIKPIFFSTGTFRPQAFRYQFAWLPALFALGGAAAGAFFYLTRIGNFSNYLSISGLLATGGLLLGTAVALHHRFMDVPIVPSGTDRA